MYIDIDYLWHYQAFHTKNKGTWALIDSKKILINLNKSICVNAKKKSSRYNWCFVRLQRRLAVD
jgi:hypothetical protein